MAGPDSSLFLLPASVFPVDGVALRLGQGCSADGGLEYSNRVGASVLDMAPRVCIMDIL